MRLVSKTNYVNLTKAFGVTEDDYKLVTGSNPWLGVDRPRVRQVLDMLAAGIMDLTGTARFEMPAEYIAAVVAVFVHPTNCMVACQWQSNMRPADEILGASSQAMIVDPAVLFVLVCKIYGDEHGASQIKAAFDKKVGRAIFKSIQEADDATG